VNNRWTGHVGTMRPSSEAQQVQLPRWESGCLFEKFWAEDALFTESGLDWLIYRSSGCYGATPQCLGRKDVVIDLPGWWKEMSSVSILAFTAGSRSRPIWRGAVGGGKSAVRIHANGFRMACRDRRVQNWGCFWKFSGSFLFGLCMCGVLVRMAGKLGIVWRRLGCPSRSCVSGSRKMGPQAAPSILPPLDYGRRSFCERLRRVANG
jgi:hypothetical protein